MGLEFDGPRLVGASGGPDAESGALVLDGVAVASTPVSPAGSGEREETGGDLARLVEEVRSQLPGRPGRVRLGVGGPDTAMRLIDVPRPRRSADLQAVIAQEAEHKLPLSLARSRWTSRVLGTFSDTEGSRRARVLIAAAKRDAVDPLCAAVREAGCEVVGVDLSAFAAIRALPARSGTWLGAVLGAQTTLFVAEGRECLLTRSPGDLPGTVTPREGAVADEGGANEIARRLSQEIQKTCQYHATLDGAVPVSHVALTGPGADNPQLVTEIANSLNLPASVEAPRAAAQSAQAAPCGSAVAGGLCIEVAA